MKRGERRSEEGLRREEGRSKDFIAGLRVKLGQLTALAVYEKVKNSTGADKMKKLCEAALRRCATECQTSVLRRTKRDAFPVRQKMATERER